MMSRSKRNAIQQTFWNFVNSEQSGGLILILCAIAALIISNSPLNTEWFNLWEYKVGPEFLHLKKNLLHWVNDGLMTIFFLLVGLEIKREIIEGELSTPKKALLPIVAALGGMIIPAFVYSVVNYNSNSSNGWGIPMATDIAFALGVLSLLGKRVPFSLKILLTALAIVDDLGAIVVIAIFYTKEIYFQYLFLGFGIVFLLSIFNWLKVNSMAVYLIFGVVLWYLFLKSGIHATISGVLLAFTIPLGKGREISTLETLEHFLHKPVAFFIMPLFALANTGLIFDTDLPTLAKSTLSMGVFLGLFLGKPIGIITFTFLANKTNLIKLPSGCTWLQIIGVGFLAGIGFTMSIFITLLAFDDINFQNYAKISILVASVVAGLTGFLIMKKAT